MNKMVGHLFEDKLRVAIQRFRALMNLRADTDEEGTIESVRLNVDFRSANAWTLAFAIMIASIGLNTNSAAVIIGAMLISPLMGPIIGAGVGLGINDLPLVKRALSNLGYAVGISILVSLVYFSVSPLSEAQSELLARTRPTFFDAMIAIFGGAAGIVALSRKEKGNAIPGVAIATALMPPLCTAGYALSKGNFPFFFGAMYLFVINSVYICLSTLVFIKYLGFKKVAMPDPADRQRLRRWVIATALLVLFPSLVSAWFLLRESAFRSRANSFVKHELQIEGAFVVGSEIDYNWRNPKLIVSVIGEPISQENMDELRLKMTKNLLPRDALEIHQSSLAERIEQKIKSGLAQEHKESEASDLRLASLEYQLGHFKRAQGLSNDITLELHPLFPKLRKILVIAQNVSSSEEPQLAPSAIHVQWGGRPSKPEIAKVNGFLQSRMKEPGLSISHLVYIGSPPATE
ncbi:MAG: TIGR00341 family protein [Bacteriovoracia bacterium]